MDVSFIFRINTLRIQIQCLSSYQGQQVTMFSMKAPLLPTCKVLGFTSTQFPLQYSGPAISAKKVRLRFYEQRKTIFVSFLLLFFTTANLINLKPSSFTISLLHPTKGIFAPCFSYTASTPQTPSIATTNFALILQSVKFGVLTPTTKLQVPLCTALNLNQSQYSQLFSFLMPKIYSGRSVRCWSSQTILIEMTFGQEQLYFRVIPNLRSCTLAGRHSPKSMVWRLRVRSQQICGVGVRKWPFQFIWAEQSLSMWLVIQRRPSFIVTTKCYKVYRSEVLIRESLNRFIIVQMSKYQGRVDPLDLLRTAYTEDKKIKLKDKNLVFQKDIRMPLGQLTAWVSPITKKQYSLGSLWLYLEHHLKHITDYMNKISEYGVQNVTISDRDEVTNYFLGKTNDSACINQEAKLQLSIKNNPQRAQPTTGFEQGVDPVKKQKVQHSLPFELQVIEFIYKFQRPTSSKTRSLRCPHKSFEGLLDFLKTTSTTETAPTSNDDKKMRINTFMEQKKNPIIVVPEHLHPGNLCIGNIQKFLEGGQYSESQGQVGFKRWVQLQHSIRGKKVKFDITNNPSILRQQDWNFVVAVFVEGRRREFQGWTIKEPVDLFRKTKGFLLRFPTKQSTQAQQWNIRILTLDKNVRYRDSEVRGTIWKDIEQFLSQKI